MVGVAEVEEESEKESGHQSKQGQEDQVRAMNESYPAASRKLCILTSLLACK